jgi:hypothetical protein
VFRESYHACFGGLAGRTPKFNSASVYRVNRITAKCASFTVRPNILPLPARLSGQAVESRARIARLRGENPIAIPMPYRIALLGGSIQESPVRRP